MELITTNDSGTYKLDPIGRPVIVLPTSATGTELVLIGRVTTAANLPARALQSRGITITPNEGYRNNSVPASAFGQRIRLIYTGTPVELQGVIGSGLSKPGFEYSTREAASSADFRNGYYGQHRYYDRGSKLQFTLKDVPESDILTKWGAITAEISRHPYVVILSRQPFNAAYVWGDVPVPTTSRPGFFDIAWNLTCFNTETPYFERNALGLPT